MKTLTKLALLGSLALGVAAWTLVAQDSGDRSPDGDRPPRRQDGPPTGRDGQRPLPPLLAALDANHDGVIDADEIKNASAALLKLDKNGDGKLTPDEFMGRPPGRPDGGPGAGPPRPDGPPAGGSPDRPQSRRDARFDDGGRPPFPPPGNELGEFRPPRDGRGPGGADGREFADRGGPGARGGGAPSADSILQRFDTDKDGQLNKSELAAFLKDMQSRRPPPLAGGPRPGGPGGPGGRDGFGGPPPEDGPPR